MTSIEKSAADLRADANDDTATASRFYRLADAYSGDVREQMLLFGLLHEKRAELNNEIAAKFERLSSKGRRAS